MRSLSGTLISGETSAHRMLLKCRQTSIPVKGSSLILFPSVGVGIFYGAKLRLAWNCTDFPARHQRFLLNSYRVLLTRAREGMVLWVPPGHQSDLTREPEALDNTAKYLESCGARWISTDSK